MHENDDVDQSQSGQSEGQPASQPPPEQTAEQPPPPPPAAPQPGPDEPIATGPAEPKPGWRDRVFGLRSMIAVGLAGLILGAGAATTTALVADGDADHDGYHERMDSPGDRGGFRPGGDDPRSG